MANETAPNEASNLIDSDRSESTDAGGIVQNRVLLSLASLKLTVVLFAMAIFIVLAGTFAQVEKDIWQVIADYFRIDVNDFLNGDFPWLHLGAAFTWIDFRIFFPPSFFPSRPTIPGGFYFPKGWLIGLALAVNLAAAHLVRFKVRAQGVRLWAGWGVIVLGTFVTWLVIASGAKTEGFQQTSLLDWSTLWFLMKWSLVAVWIAVAVWLGLIDPNRKAQRWLAVSVLATLGVFLVWLFVRGDAVRLGDSSMRILWELVKGTLAGLVLLAGATMVFRKQGGSVLIHAGMALIMFGELLVGTTAEEGQMTIEEGKTVNYTVDGRALELAIVDSSPSEYDDVVVVPGSILADAGTGDSEPIRHEELPFDVQVVRFMRNSQIRNVTPEDTNPATAGAGLFSIVEETRPVSGTDNRGSIDISSGYVKLLGKESDTDLGTYLVSLYLKPQNVQVGEKTYTVELRHKQVYKPYSVHLIDVRKDDYIGTDMPRNYSSDIRLLENDATRRHLPASVVNGSSRNTDREIHIWMNNPLRYAGETFYQSGYRKDPATGVETTTLQVVTNPGWMIPYVACMIVSTGMLAHFWIVLLRFLNRREESQDESQARSEIDNRTAETDRKNQREEHSRNIAASKSVARWEAEWLVPLLLVSLFAFWAASKAAPPRYAPDEMNLYEFGKLPLVYKGRVKPFDTLARNSLRVISDRQTFVDQEGHRQPAIRWLLDVMARPDVADKHEVFRIQNLEVLDTLGLQPRRGFRYSVSEMLPRIEEFEKQFSSAHAVPAEDRSVYQRKIIELRQRMSTYRLLTEAFQRPFLPPLPDPHSSAEGKDADAIRDSFRKFKEALDVARMRNQQLAQNEPPLAVPVTIDSDTADVPRDLRAWLPKRQSWETYAEAWTNDFIRQQLFHKEANPGTLSLQAILIAYEEGDSSAFNREVSDRLDALSNTSLDELDMKKISFEEFFNHSEPFYYASLLYLVAFILTALSWLGWSRPLNRSAFWLIALSFVLHSLALAARIYISGRPPVTNLYSSAVFIGWGGVILGWFLELVYGRGIGNVIAAVTGFATLLIAHMLAGDGDTFTVLQAVLDTQFWLTTHVVTISLGYATTFVAGLLGVFYIVRGVATPSLTRAVSEDLTRMIYGTLCFSIFFSFIGTVLGGLWADDSWGRFWGWDPKENGALIIVLWNALVLHALWGGLVKERGLAVLAVAGNVATSWSWFGVNELGVGLHTYGFTEGVLLALGLFVLSQFVIIIAGCIPTEHWWSYPALSEPDVNKSS